MNMWTVTQVSKGLCLIILVVSHGKCGQQRWLQTWLWHDYGESWHVEIQARGKIENAFNKMSVYVILFNASLAKK